MRPTSPPEPHAAPAVRRHVDLDLDPADALDAVTRPELLSEWLGRWTEGPDGTTVVTDDGVARAVQDLARTADGVSWTWAPADGGPASSVTIEVTPLGPGRSRVAVRETALAASRGLGSAAGGIALDGLGWAVCLLALEIAAAARSLAAAPVR